jgi:tetratricopeptide (TPR) repeat protein
VSRVEIPAERFGDLENERDFLLRSLEDLDDEHSAGEVSEEDYERLRDQYTARAAQVLRALDVAASPAGEPSLAAETQEEEKGSHARKRSQWLLVGGIGFVVAGLAVALIALNTGNRLPGNTETGGVSLAPAQAEARELDQATVLEEGGNYSEAIKVFEEVLAQDPDNVEALASAGWLEFEAGVLGTNTSSLEEGETEEERAVTLDPAEPVPHAYLGSMYFVEGQISDAVVQYDEFIGADPSGGEVAPFLPDIKKAFKDAKTPLPALPAGS